MNSHNGHATHGVSHGRRDDALADGPNELSRTDGALAAAAPAEPRTVQTTAGPGRKPRSRFSVARTARMCIALALITAALWWLVVPFFVPVTSQAVVNARMVQVRAPIDGAAVELLHDIGDSVQAGAPLLKVVSGQADTSHLAELAARRAGLAAQRERLNSELEAAARTRDECHASTQRFYTELVGSLKTSVTEAEARYQAARVGQEAAHVRTARAERLAAEQTGAYAELDEARRTNPLRTTRSSRRKPHALVWKRSCGRRSRDSSSSAMRPLSSSGPVNWIPRSRSFKGKLRKPTRSWRRPTRSWRRSTGASTGCPRRPSRRQSQGPFGNGTANRARW